MFETGSQTTQSGLYEYSKSVHIIGLGWLGVPLARLLKCRNTFVNGTVRTNKKQSLLKSIQINSYLMHLDQNYPYYSQVLSNLFDTPNVIQYKCVVLNIPPGRSNFKAINFIKNMTKLIDDIFTLDVDKVIFISTTSVFGKVTGNITSKTMVQPVSESAIAHVEIEQYLMANFAEKSVILRPAGLIGENFDGSYRHPIFTLVKKAEIAQGDNGVNLIHQKDLINCIKKTIDLDLSGIALNLSSLEHPSRRDYYKWCAEKLGLSAPTFLEDTKNCAKGKIIRPEESLAKLGNLQLKYPSPYNMLPNHLV